MPLCGLFTPNRDNVWTDISLCDLFRHIMIHVWTLMPLSDLIRLSSIHFETDMPLYYFFRHNRVHDGTDMPLCTCLDIVESRVRLLFGSFRPYCSVCSHICILYHTEGLT